MFQRLLCQLKKKRKFYKKNYATLYSLDSTSSTISFIETKSIPGKFIEILLWSVLQNKPDLFPLLNVTGYWKRSNTEACNQKLSEILANNINNGGRKLVSEFM